MSPIYFAILLQSKAYCQAVAQLHPKELTAYLENFRQSAEYRQADEARFSFLFGADFSKKIVQPPLSSKPVIKQTPKIRLFAPAKPEVFSTVVAMALDQYHAAPITEQPLQADALKFELLREAERTLLKPLSLQQTKGIKLIRNIIRHLAVFISDDELVTLAKSYLQLNQPKELQDCISRCSKIKNKQEAKRQSVAALSWHLAETLKSLQHYLTNTDIVGFGVLDSCSIYAIQILSANIGSLASDLHKLGIKEKDWVPAEAISQLSAIRQFGNAISHDMTGTDIRDESQQRHFDYAISLIALKKMCDHQTGQLLSNAAMTQWKKFKPSEPVPKEHELSTEQLTLD